MKVQLFLIADYASVSSDGKLNVMGIFRGINSPGFPTKHASMYLVLTLVAELGEAGQTRDITIKMLDADGKEQLAVTGKAEIPDGGGPGMPEVNTIIQLIDVPLIKPGSHAFVVFIDKDHKAQIPFHVNQL